MHLVVKLGLCLGLFVACVPTSPSPPLPSVIASSASPSSSATASPSPAIYPSLSPTPTPLPEIRVSDAQVVAGTGEKGFRDGPALQATFNQLTGMCYGPKTQDLYILDTNMVRKLSKDGVVTTVAGVPEAGFHDGEAMQAQFNGLMDCAVAENGDIYLADYRNRRLRKLSTIEGTVSTVVGTGNPGRKDGAATEVELLLVNSLLFVTSERLYFTDSCWIRILENGVVSTLNAYQSDYVSAQGGPRYNGQEYAYDGSILDKSALFGGILTLSHGPNSIYISDVQQKQLRRLNSDQTVESLLKRNAEGVYYGAQVHDVDFLPNKNLLVIVAGNRLAVMNTEDKDHNVPFLSPSTSPTDAPFLSVDEVTVGSQNVVYLLDRERNKIRMIRFLD